MPFAFPSLFKTHPSEVHFVDDCAEAFSAVLAIFRRFASAADGEQFDEQTFPHVPCQGAYLGTEIAHFLENENSIPNFLYKQINKLMN